MTGYPQVWAVGATTSLQRLPLVKCSRLLTYTAPANAGLDTLMELSVTQTPQS